MIVVGVDNLVPGFHVETVGTDGHALSGVVGDGEFVRLAAEKICQLLANGCFVFSRQCAFHVAESIFVYLADRVDLCLVDTQRGRAAGAGVEIGDVRFDEELLGNIVPVGFIRCR